MKRNIKRKTQVWYTDFMVALLIFVITLVIYYKHVVNLSDEDKSGIEELIADSKMISSSLLSAGYPLNWTNESVERVGITNNDYRIMQDRVEAFQTLSYTQTRKLLGTRFEYFATLEDRARCLVNITSRFGLGSLNITVSPGLSPKNCTITGAQNKAVDIDSLKKKKLVRVTRLIVYGNQIARMVIYVWQ